jgi:hypothetical protein
MASGHRGSTVARQACAGCSPSICRPTARQRAPRDQHGTTAHARQGSPLRPMRCSIPSSRASGRGMPGRCRSASGPINGVTSAPHRRSTGRKLDRSLPASRPMPDHRGDGGGRRRCLVRGSSRRTPSVGIWLARKAPRNGPRRSRSRAAPTGGACHNPAGTRCCIRRHVARPCSIRSDRARGVGGACYPRRQMAGPPGLRRGVCRVGSSARSTTNRSSLATAPCSVRPAPSI